MNESLPGGKHAINLTVLMFIIVYISSFMGPGYSKIPGDLGDAVLNHYILEHGYQFLTGHVPSFWQGNFFYPTTDATIAYSDNHLGTLPVYTLFRLLGLGKYAAYQLWMVVIFLLNYLSFYLVARKFSFNRIGSHLGAVLFTFTMPMIIQLGHIQLLPRFMVPFIFYSFYQFFQTNQVRYLVWFLASLVFQFYIGLYVAFFSVEILIVFFALLVAVKNRKLVTYFRRSKQDYLLLVGTVLAAGMLLAFLLIPYYDVSIAIGKQASPWHEVSTMLPRWRSWLFMAGGMLYSWLGFMGENLPMAHEHQMFIGVTPYLLALFLLVRFRTNYGAMDGFVKYAMAILVMMFLLTLQVRGFSLYFFFYSLPGLGVIRAVTRVILVLIFFFAVIVAYALTQIIAETKGFTRVALLAFITLFTVAENIYLPGTSASYEKVEAQKIVTEIKNRLPDGQTPFYYVPVEKQYPFYTYQLAAMFASLEKNVPTVNGYSGNFPKEYGSLIYNPASFSDLKRWLSYNQSVFGQPCAKVNYITENSLTPIDCQSLGAITTADHALEDYRFELTFEAPPATIQASDMVVKLKLKNTSTNTWPALYNGKFGLAASYNLNGQGFNNRTLLPYDVAPGAEVEVEIPVSGLAMGKNTIEFSMVQELVTWFYEKTGKHYTLEIWRK